MRFGCPDPYPVPVSKQILDIRIRLKTYYPAGYPTGKPDSAKLWFLGHVKTQTKSLTPVVLSLDLWTSKTDPELNLPNLHVFTA